MWMNEKFALQAGERVLQKSPFTFDVSVWELFWPLMNGATLVMARPDGHRDSRYLVDVIRRERRHVRRLRAVDAGDVPAGAGVPSSAPACAT